MKNCKLESLTVVRGSSKLSGATLASQGDMSELTKNFGAIGGSLLNDRMEMMSTTGYSVGTQVTNYNFIIFHYYLKFRK